MSNGLIGFLRARYDEEAVLASSGETWTAFEENERTGTRRVDVDYSIERVVACTRSWRGEHIARHDPARVLRRIEAPRRAVDAYECALTAYAHAEQSVRDLMTGAVNSWEHVLRLAAQVYDDPPDFKEEWRS
ncbi:DUF6221 family protein [Streptomyces sp. NPDC052496]|uniref:DUF6221 family protein n=1 Tax=Streptomyces sp. NPDC052496 TaxID=3154951 RepID=UPI00341B95A2